MGEAQCIALAFSTPALTPFYRYLGTARLVQTRYSPLQYRVDERGTSESHTAFEVSRIAAKSSSIHRLQPVPAQKSHQKRERLTAEWLSYLASRRLPPVWRWNERRKGAAMSKRISRVARCLVSRLAITCRRLELAC